MTEQGSLDFKPQPKYKPDDLRRAAEEALAVAEKLDRRHDPGAELAFTDAEGLAVKCADMEIQMRVFASSGGFHERRKAFSLALKKYGTALQNARCLSDTSDGGVEYRCHIRYKLLRIQNHEDRAFKNLQEVAQSTDTYQTRCKAWDGYVGDVGQPMGRLAARGLGSKDDFRRRLDAAKLDPSDDENEE